LSDSVCKKASPASKSTSGICRAHESDKNNLIHTLHYDSMLYTIIQHMQEAVYLIDRNFRVLLANDAGLRSMNLPPGTQYLILDDSIDSGIIRDDSGKILGWEDSLHARAINGETVVNLSQIHTRSDGSKRYYIGDGCPIHNDTGEVEMALIMSRDVTEIKELQSRTVEQIREIYNREHNIAEKLQESFLLAKCPKIDGFEIASRYEAAWDEAMVGGDFLDVFPISEDKFGVVISDVAGKGLKAAVYTAMTKYMLRAYALEDSSPDIVMAKLNTALFSCTPLEVFITLVYGILDAKTGMFAYANAGHEQPIFFRKTASIATTLYVTGKALALLPDSIYNIQTIRLLPDDVLVLYTDGITDAGSGENRFGTEQLLKQIELNASISPNELADVILNQTKQLSGPKLVDDVAILIVKAVSSA